MSLPGDVEFKVPDHGDIVALPTSVFQADSKTLIMTTRGRCADFEFIRKISLYDNLVELSYKLVNRGNYVFPFLWCMHPLLAIDPTMKIDLDCSVPFTVEAAFGDSPFREGERFRWSGSNSKKVPSLADSKNSPFAMKFFSDAESIQAVSVLAPDSQEKLVFSWDNQMARYLGIWLNYGAWSGDGSKGSYCLGVEPSSSPCDSLSQAVQGESAQYIKPGEIREWVVEVSVMPYHVHQYPYSTLQTERSIK